MSKNRFFELHLTLLNQIINLQKHERLKILSLINDVDDNTIDDLTVEKNEIYAHFFTTLIANDIKKYLLDYINLKPVNDQIKFVIPYSLKSFVY
jgi:hypothetical protein